MIRSAVILAAGRGSRLGGQTSKPLVPVAGISLIGRALLGLRSAGIDEVLVVLGYQAEQLDREIHADAGHGLRVRSCLNPAWHRSNGLSLLAAEPLVHEPFLLLMADHLFDPAIVERVRAAPLERFAGVLAVDRRHEDVFDLADATKVLLADDRIERIGKQLELYNAVDTGIFALTPRIFAELRLAAEQDGGDCSLSQGIDRLCRAGLMGWLDCSGLLWLDVDTPEALARAEVLVASPAGSQI